MLDLVKWCAVSAWERVSVGDLTRRRSLKQTRNLWCIPISSVSGDVFVFVADANNSKLVLGFLLPTVSAEALFFFFNESSYNIYLKDDKASGKHSRHHLSI